MADQTYQCTIETVISFGQYIWCGNGSSPMGAGFTLSNVDPDTVGIGAKYVGSHYGDLNSYLVTFVIKMNNALARDTEHIEMFLPNGFLFGYNVGRISNGVWITSKKIDPSLLDQSVTIKFGRYLSQTESDRSRLRRPILGAVYETQITMREPKQYETEVCSICLEDVNNIKNKYLSPCGHLFHLDCIFKYLENSGHLYEIPTRCMDRCCQSPKIKPFNCPVCRQVIINSSVRAI
jgi:hypothetical protein